MDTYYYYQSFRRTIIMFLDIFNGIKVARYASDGATIRKYVTVPIKFSPKEKIWHWVNQRKDDEMLPMISAMLSSVEFAPDRMGNKLGKVLHSKSPSADTITRFTNPVPYNLGFTLNLWSLHMVDIDQILEQILPYFSPYVVTRINIPQLDSNFDIKVVFQSCTPDLVHEMADEEWRIVRWTMDFQVQTYLFRPTGDEQLIKQIFTKYYMEQDSWDNRQTYTDGTTETTFTSGASGWEGFSTSEKALAPWYDSTGAVVSVYEQFDVT